MCFALEDNEWVTKENLASARTKAGASSISEDGSMMVTGGIDDGGLTSVEMYEHGHWSSGEPLPGERYGHCQIWTGSRIYVLGKKSEADDTFQNQATCPT